MLSAEEIRQRFLAYFESKGHTVCRSASLIPDDTSVLLTIAGMLQFKPYFMGLKKSPFMRASSVQKCIRTNDIESVGKTKRHQTFFEMLGNFSFGDYFKRDAILFAWEFLTKDLNLDISKLYISVYEKDDESYVLWQELTGISSNRIFRLSEESNFWSAGLTGPCGPCSEIYYDMGEIYGCQHLNCGPGCDCDRYLEIWNLVFMEFNRDETGMLTLLPTKNIDTGMGLERITSIVQQVDSNFDTDLFVPIIRHIQRLAGKNPSVLALRVMADHLRASIFLIGDGVLPGNDGREYVLRKLIRRTVRFGRLIGITKFFLKELAETIIQLNRLRYPEIYDNQLHILMILGIEEENFSKTLIIGLQLLQEKMEQGGCLSGDDAFKLYDTFGFPFDLTAEICAEKNISVDIAAFNSLMQQQKYRGRAGAQFHLNTSDMSEVKPIGGEAIIAKTDAERNSMARHHSATHLLQSVLIQVLGVHVKQAGSLVSPEKLRFDFTHYQALSVEQLMTIEREINRILLQNIPISICEMAYQDAISTGAMALFTEKYGDTVRVVKIGNISAELCGGTHVSATGDIGIVTLLSDVAVGSGIRRIEAYAGEPAYEYLTLQKLAMQQLAGYFKTATEGVVSKVEVCLDQVKTLQKEIVQLNQLSMKSLARTLISKKETICGVDLLVTTIADITMELLKVLVDECAVLCSNGIVVVASIIGEQVFWVVKCSDSSVLRGCHAGQLLKLVAEITGGKGGGSSKMAQGGGKFPSKVSIAIDAVLCRVNECLSKVAV